MLDVGRRARIRSSPFLLSLVPTTSVAVPASRSRILPATLVASGPMRLVVDMLRAAQGLVSAAEVLSGLVALPEGLGAGQAADMFAAIASATANEIPGTVPSDAEEACTRELRRQVGRFRRLFGTGWIFT